MGSILKILIVGDCRVMIEEAFFDRIPQTKKKNIRGRTVGTLGHLISSCRWLLLIPSIDWWEIFLLSTVAISDKVNASKNLRRKLSCFKSSFLNQFSSKAGIRYTSRFHSRDGSLKSSTISRYEFNSGSDVNFHRFLYQQSVTYTQKSCYHISF